MSVTSKTTPAFGTGVPSSTQAPISTSESKTAAALSGSSTAEINIRPPIKYAVPDSQSWQAPPLEWLQGTWSVTHSTLPMWRKAKNVRITYKIIPPSSPDGLACLDDEVCSEPTARTLLPQPKSIKGIDTPDGAGGWNWRGKGWLKIATSQWEVLGWGEKGDEKWAVTYFAASMFTPAGLDIYSSKKEGISADLVKDIISALQGSESRDMAALVTASMKEVKIEY
ncbi:hypothetical protein BP5796_09009 [Coleophoma crateriformis]|uniref:Uncharacterized protein n=1 Tax=Coleophoma crateriformis TaxID=565419 RepID=A0A3D8R2S0_9HELO|nr:hypothetical protein BP5796_09009 [Coleophoma crateriformis]